LLGAEPKGSVGYPALAVLALLEFARRVRDFAAVGTAAEGHGFGFAPDRHWLLPPADELVHGHPGHGPAVFAVDLLHPADAEADAIDLLFRGECFVVSDPSN